MTTKYRLPDSLGGHECTGYGHTDSDGQTNAFAVIDGMHVEIVLPMAMLVEVKPPLPPEPPDGSVVRVDNPGQFRVFERDDRIAIGEGRRWWTAGRDGARTWAQVCSKGTPVLLVPDPLGEPVEVPWLLPIGDYETLAVYVDSNAVVTGLRGGTQNGLTPSEARNYARALWAAAAKAERPASHSREGQ